MPKKNSIQEYLKRNDFSIVKYRLNLLRLKLDDIENSLREVIKDRQITENGGYVKWIWSELEKKYENEPDMAKFISEKPVGPKALEADVKEIIGRGVSNMDKMNLDYLNDLMVTMFKVNYAAKGYFENDFKEFSLDSFITNENAVGEYFNFDVIKPLSDVQREIISNSIELAGFKEIDNRQMSPQELMYLRKELADALIKNNQHNLGDFTGKTNDEDIKEVLKTRMIEIVRTYRNLPNNFYGKLPKFEENPYDQPGKPLEDETNNEYDRVTTPLATSNTIGNFATATSTENYSELPKTAQSLNEKEKEEWKETGNFSEKTRSRIQERIKEEKEKSEKREERISD